jgi:hypothetical protein
VVQAVGWPGRTEDGDPQERIRLCCARGPPGRKGIRRGSRQEAQPSKRDPPRPPTKGERRRSPNEWAENRSAQSNPRAEHEARSTRNGTGIDTERQG